MNERPIHRKATDDYRWDGVDLLPYKEDGRALFATVGGLVAALAVSGVIEGFVTRQEWPDVIRIGIGTVALAAFLWVQWGLGRRAALAGETGDLDPISRGARVVVAD